MNDTRAGNGPAPAVFLDRDGTIIEDRGDLARPEQVVFLPPAVPALRLLQRRFRLFVVTHQGGIGLGTLSRAEVDRVNRFLLARLAAAGVRIERVYCCPHQRVENCRCIKPRPFHPRVAARRYGLDLGASFAVGDHPHDVQLGLNFGGRGVYVLSGHGARHLDEVPPGVPVVADIGAAAELIADGGRGGHPAPGPGRLPGKRE